MMKRMITSIEILIIYRYEIIYIKVNVAVGK